MVDRLYPSKYALDGLALLSDAAGHSQNLSRRKNLRAGIALSGISCHRCLMCFPHHCILVIIHDGHIEAVKEESGG